MANNQKYEYGAVMIDCNFKNWDKILCQINKNDVYDEDGFGLETYPHTTILYGLHDNIDHNAVISLCATFEPISITTMGVDCFNNDQYDVLKINCTSESLSKYRKQLMDNFKNTQTFKDYHPHITIAYLKKGRGIKYHSNAPISLDIYCDTITYSQADGKKNKIKLNQINQK